MRISRKWRRRLILWAVSFLAGAALRWWLGDDLLLVVVLVVSLLAAFLRAAGMRGARKVEHESLDYLWGTVRGMFVSALLPGAWEALRALLGQQSAYGLQTFLLLAAVIAVVWLFFDLLPRGWGVRPRRRRPRRRQPARPQRPKQPRM